MKEIKGTLGTGATDTGDVTEPLPEDISSAPEFGDHGAYRVLRSLQRGKGRPLGEGGGA